MKIMLQDIIQSYTQSKIELNHIVSCHLPDKLKKNYLKGIDLCVAKPLYDLLKARNYWFATYSDHNRKKLEIEISPYDICFLITKGGGKNFSIVGFQTDNTLNINTKVFIKKEETEVMEAKFKSKTQTILKIST